MQTVKIQGGYHARAALTEHCRLRAAAATVATHRMGHATRVADKLTVTLTLTLTLILTIRPRSQSWLQLQM